MSDVSDMSDREVTTLLSVSPGEAFRLLEDPGSFQHLVAGARRIRRFDSRWPEEGTRLYHTVGIPPLVVRDHTEVVEEHPPARLALDAHIRPLGRLAVEFRIEPHGGGSRLTVHEEPVGGPVDWPLVRRATRLALRLRNREICRRFRNLTDLRHRSAGGGAGA